MGTLGSKRQVRRTYDNGKEKLEKSINHRPLTLSIKELTIFVLRMYANEKLNLTEFYNQLSTEITKTNQSLRQLIRNQPTTCVEHVYN